MTTERKVQSSIISYLSKLKDDGHPIMYERRQAGGFSYKKGIPDLYAVYNGQHIEIEVKKPGGSTSSAQDTWARRYKQINVPYICADNIEEFKEFMQQFIRR